MGKVVLVRGRRRDSVALAKLINKPSKVTKPTATPKRERYTLEKMIAKNKEIGSSGLQVSRHPDRHYDVRVHQGPGGVYFVFASNRETGYRVRRFTPDGHTHPLGNYGFRYATLRDAHKVAEFLAHPTLPSLPVNLDTGEPTFPYIAG